MLQEGLFLVIVWFCFMQYRYLCICTDHIRLPMERSLLYLVWYSLLFSLKQRISDRIWYAAVKCKVWIAVSRRATLEWTLEWIAWQLDSPTAGSWSCLVKNASLAHAAPSVFIWPEHYVYLCPSALGFLEITRISSPQFPVFIEYSLTCPVFVW